MNRRLLALFVFSVVSPLALAQSYPVTDSFSAPLNTPLSSNWTGVTVDAKDFDGTIVQDSGVVTVDPANKRGMAVYTGAPFSVSAGGTSDQKVSVTFFGQQYALDSSSGPCVRADTAGNGYCYFPQNGQIAKLLASRQSYPPFNGVPGGGPSPATTYVVHFGSCPLGNVADNFQGGHVSDGDTVSLQIVGDILTCKDETTGRAYSATDSTIKTGSPGIFLEQEVQLHTVVLGSFSADCIPTCGPTAQSTTALTATPNPATFGQSVTLTATVTGAGASGKPTGTVTFLNGTAALGMGTVDSSGVATYTAPSLGAGSYAVTAKYSGDGTYPTSTSPSVALTVSMATTTTSLTANPNPATFGQSVTLGATVTGISGAATPTGTVTFLNGSTTLGTGTLSGGVATYTATSLAVGSYPITAQYVGDGNYSTSISPSVTEVVKANTVVGGGYIVIATPSSISIPSKGTGTVQLATTSINGYTGIVTFACSTTSPVISCSLAGSPVTLTAGSTQNAMLTIKANGTTTGLNHPHSLFQGLSPLMYSAMVLWLPGSLLGLLMFGRKDKHLRRLLMLFLLCAGFAGAVSMTGCGSDNTEKKFPNHYTVTVTANDGVISAQTTTVDVVIQ